MRRPQLLRGIVQGYRTKLPRAPPSSFTCSSHGTSVSSLIRETMSNCFIGQPGNRSHNHKFSSQMLNELSRWGRRGKGGGSKAFSCGKELEKSTPEVRQDALYGANDNITESLRSIYLIMSHYLEWSHNKQKTSCDCQTLKPP